MATAQTIDSVNRKPADVTEALQHLADTVSNTPAEDALRGVLDTLKPQVSNIIGAARDNRIAGRNAHADYERGRADELARIIDVFEFELARANKTAAVSGN